MILLVLFILFQYSFQIIRSLCQDACEAGVGIVLRSRCQGECDADVKMNVLHYVFPFCELGGDLFHELCQRAYDADVIIMRSRCQGECETTVKSNAKPMSYRARSRCREGTHTRTRRMEVHTHTNTLMPNGLLALLLSLQHNIVSPLSPLKCASRSYCQSRLLQNAIYIHIYIYIHANLTFGEVGK